MKKVIIKLKGENTYWKKQTCGTTKDINEAHHFPLAEASEITHFARSVEAIAIPNEGKVTIRTRDRYWTSYFGTFTDDKAFATLFDRDYAKVMTRNHNEDTVIEDANVKKSVWKEGGYLKRPMDESEECDKVNPESLKEVAESLELIECDCVSMKNFCNCDGPNPVDQGKFEGILTSLNSLLEYKNKKYGNVALEPLNIFAKYGGIGQRLDDKLSRIKNAEELRKNDIADMLGYLVLLCKEHGFENFDEFKD
jgi:hypothetical protein